MQKQNNKTSQNNSVATMCKQHDKTKKNQQQIQIIRRSLNGDFVFLFATASDDFPPSFPQLRYFLLLVFGLFAIVD